MGMYSDNRFDNELSEDGNGLSEEEMARATEVIVPAPDATPTPGNQASGNQAPGNQEAADVSQEDFRRRRCCLMPGSVCRSAVPWV